LQSVFLADRRISMVIAYRYENDGVI